VTRHAQRLAAVELLYAADVRGVDGAVVLDERQSEDPVGEYTAKLVRAVDRSRSEIDALLAAKAIGWPPERMSPVDRNVLRIGVAELMGGGVPPAVVLDEAVELAKHFSGEEAGRFVNGVLAAVLHERQDPGRSSS